MQIDKSYSDFVKDAHEMRARYIGSLLKRGWNAMSRLFRSASKAAALPRAEQSRDNPAHGLPAS